MSGSPRLALPFLSAGQAQKEATHNEALQTLDILVAAAVEQEPLGDPPAAPAPGACYLVDTSPTGAWAGKPQTVAGYTSGGWRFVAPVEGMTVYVKTTMQFAFYRSGSWEMGQLRGASIIIDGKQVVASRAAAIGSPAGGSTTDIEARATINDVLNVLRHHGLIEA
jgi:Protein of unknown function (DUF2793)